MRIRVKEVSAEWAVKTFGRYFRNASSSDNQYLCSLDNNIFKSGIVSYHFVNEAIVMDDIIVKNNFFRNNELISYCLFANLVKLAKKKNINEIYVYVNPSSLRSQKRLLDWRFTYLEDVDQQCKYLYKVE